MIPTLDGDASPAHHHGESLTVLERVVVAPSVGIFRHLPADRLTAEGSMVLEGQSVGTLETGGSSTPVCSAFTGFLMGMLARPGERVRAGQPVAWLRGAGA